MGWESGLGGGMQGCGMGRVLSLPRASTATVQEPECLLVTEERRSR